MNLKILFNINLLSLVLSIFIFVSGCSKLSNPVELGQGSCTASQCHEATPLRESVPLSGNHTIHLSSGIICENCHHNYLDMESHKNGSIDGNLNGENTDNPNGIIVYFNSENLSASWIHESTTCSGMECHSTADWYGTASFGCTDCHQAGKTTGAVDPLTTGGSGDLGKHIKHVTESGISCEKCHFGYTGNEHHSNGVPDAGNPDILLTVFDITNPNGAWTGDSGPNSGSCSDLSCHGSSTLDWYGSGTWSLPACPDCHKKAIGLRRQVYDSNGDGTGTGGDFNRESHHIIDYGNRNTQIVQDSDCKVCHDQFEHMNGSIRLKDKDSGDIYVYDQANPSGLEPFCLSCHDSDGAAMETDPFSPFSSANTLGTAPNRDGTEISTSWNKSRGHRMEGLTCMGSGVSGTGCHGDFATGAINAHGSDNRGLLSNRMTVPVTNTTWDENRYALCIDCHAEYPSLLTIEELTGTAEGSNYAQYLPVPYYLDFIVTGFHDYATGMHSSNYQYPLHIYHLRINQWYYRGVDDPNYRSNMTCFGCHNVHGSNSMYFLWDEWQFFIVNDSGTEYGKIENGSFTNLDYPAFCSVTCHSDANYRYPRSTANEAKAIAYDTSSSGTGLHNGDSVVIYFSDSTNGPQIDKDNIDSVLALSGSHTWVDPTDTTGVSAVWSSSGGKSNNILTITLIMDGAAPDPDIASGDEITFDGATITDDTSGANPIKGKMDLTGGF